MKREADLSTLVRSWLRETDEDLPDSTSFLRDVIAAVPSIPQQRHRWSLFGPLPFRRRAVHGARVSDRVLHGLDVTRYERGTRTGWRSVTMFSAVRVIATVAVVALGTGLVLSTGHGGWPVGPGAAPAVVSASPAPSPSTSPGTVPSPDEPLTAEQLNDLTVKANYDCDTAALEELFAVDAIHTAVDLDSVRVYRGIDAIKSLATASCGFRFTRFGPVIEFEAPEGQLLWTSVTNLSGKMVPCSWWARDGKIQFQQCLIAEQP